MWLMSRVDERGRKEEGANVQGAAGAAASSRLRQAERNRLKVGVGCYISTGPSRTISKNSVEEDVRAEDVYNECLRARARQ